jgi:hypothetical protein
MKAHAALLSTALLALLAIALSAQGPQKPEAPKSEIQTRAEALMERARHLSDSRGTHYGLGYPRSNACFFSNSSTPCRRALSNRSACPISPCVASAHSPSIRSSPCAATSRAAISIKCGGVVCRYCASVGSPIHTRMAAPPPGAPFLASYARSGDSPSFVCQYTFLAMNSAITSSEAFPNTHCCRLKS